MNRASRIRIVLSATLTGSLASVMMLVVEGGHQYPQHFAWASHPPYVGILLGLLSYSVLLYMAMGAGIGLVAGILSLGVLTLFKRLPPWLNTAVVSLTAFAPFFLYVGFFVNRHYLPSVRSGRSILGNIVLLILGGAAVFLLGLSIHGYLNRPPAERRSRFPKAPAWIIVALLAVAIVSGAGALLAVSGGVESPDGRRDRPNVLLFLLETTRADHLSCYGYHRRTTPNIDGLAAEGALFERYYVQAPFSGPSKASLHTGLYPHHHGVRTHPQEISSKVTTLAEVLRERGYATGGFASGVFMGPEFGYHRGFMTYECLGTPFDARRFATNLRGLDLFFHKLTPWYLTKRARYEVVDATNGVDRVLDWIDNVDDRPFFCLFELNEPHNDYDPPAPFDTLFVARDPDYTLMSDFKTRKLSLYDMVYDLESQGYTEKDIEHTIGLYDGEIAYVDHAIGRVADALRDRGILDETIVLVTSDHGENFGEHGTYFAHTQLYESAIHVPLVLRYPPVVEPTKVETLAQEVDVFPTVLDLAGIENAEPVDGESFGPALKGEGQVEERTLFAEDNILKDPRLMEYERYRVYLPGVEGKWRMARKGDWKLIRIPNPEGTIFELYNVAEDPLERTNLVEEKPEKLAELKAELDAWMADDQAGNRQIDPAAVERMKEDLKALGYIE
jgi:arylsulfatase A-like enzyme